MHAPQQLSRSRNDRASTWSLEQLRQHPWIAVCVSGSLASAIYAVAAHLPLAQPLVIPAAAIDAQVPFLPWAAWPYATYAFLLPALALVASKLAGFERVLLAAIATALLNAVIYVVWPTALDVRTDAPAGTLLALIQQLDTTLCALPSGHVSLPTAITTAALLVSFDVPGSAARHWRWIAAGFCLWTVVLAASTLFTKQHYVIDVAAGAIFGLTMGISVAGVRFTSAVERGERTQAGRRSGRIDSVAGGCV